MMKQFYLIGILLLATATTASGQLTDVLTGLNFPYGLAADGDTLYFTESKNGTISKIDISQDNPQPEVLLSGLTEPYALLFHDGALIFSARSPDRVVRYEPATAMSTTIWQSDQESSISGLQLDGDLLYLSRGGQLVRTDLSQSDPPLEVIAGGLDPLVQMVIKDNMLYASEFLRHRVLGFDLSATFPVTPTVVASDLLKAAGLILDGDYLYVTNSNAVTRLDLSVEPPALEQLATGISQSRWATRIGPDLYITQVGGITFTNPVGKIVRLALPVVFTDPAAVCFSTTPTDLGGASPSGGVYSGTGVTDNGDGATFTLNTSVTGSGPAAVTYMIGETSTMASVEVLPADDSNCVAAALNFDGSDDYVSVPLTPAVLTGDSVAISGWVRVDSSADNSPEGIMGWRNDLDADFFLVKLNQTGMEARFRNSTGQAFTLVSDQIQVGVWQHWTLTYDGAELILYLNGAVVESTPATGQLASTGPNFHLGNVDFMGEAFSLNGDLDEVRIWSRGLNCFEASQLYECELADNQRTGLIGYYQFHQGVIDGDNTAITELSATVGPNGMLNNLALTGGSSNFISESAVVTGTTCGPLNSSTVTNLTGNGSVILNGDTTPATEDGTDFGDVELGQSVTREFQLGLIGNLPQPLLGLDNPAFSTGEFKSDGTFKVTFRPTTGGVETGTIFIGVADCTIDYIYSFTVTGKGVALPGAAFDFKAGYSFINVPVSPAHLSGDAVTIAGWVYPEALDDFTTTGLFGWWNEDDNYFYLQQVSDNGIAVRFRNSNDIPYSFLSFSLTPDTWQHLAMSYDGETLTLYKNGIVVSRIFANGSLVASNNDFIIGAASELDADFLFGGQMDEVTIWDRALGCNELQSYLECELTGTEAGLLAYYRFNQGFGNGDNTGITALAATVGPDASLQNFPLTGGNGNFIAAGAVPSGVSCAPVETPAITVSNNGTPIANGDDTPTIDDGTDLGTVLAGTTASSVFQIGLTGNLVLQDITRNEVQFDFEFSPNDNLLTVLFTPNDEGTQTATIGIEAISCETTVRFTFDVTGTGELPPPPANDACTDANDINPLFGQGFGEPQLSETWNVLAATADPSDPYNEICYGDSLARTIWYAFTGDGNNYSLSSVQCGNSASNVDTQVAVFQGDCTDLMLVTCDENSGYNAHFTVEIPTEPGVSYLVMVDGYSNSTGNFCLEVTNLTTTTVTELKETDLHIFPNPTSGLLQLPPVKNLRRVEVYDATGRLVRQQTQPGPTLHLDRQPAGIYFLKLYIGGAVYSARVIKE